MCLTPSCSAPPTPHPAKTPAKPLPPQPPAEQLPGAPVATAHKLRDAPEAPHGGFILQIVTSLDGAAAVSVDELGGVRLWPTLDGTREPRVIELPQAKQLALARGPNDGFQIIALDEVGGLYFAKLDNQARTLSHATLPPEPAFAGIAMTELGLLAWRVDQTIVLLDADGATKARIATKPKERVVAIAAANKRAIAITEIEDGSRSVRWLDIDPKLAWGGEIYLGGDPGQDIALSPKHTYYAIARREERSTLVQVVDVAKKKVVASTNINMQGVDLAFTDDTTLAIGTFEGISWVDTTLPMPVMSQVTRTSGSRVAPTLAAANGKAITTQNGELVLATPSTTQFLGYDLVAPRFVEPAGNGQLLVGVKEAFTLIGANLRETPGNPGSWASIALPTNTMTQVLWLGGSDWLVETAAGGATPITLSVVDVAKNVTTPLRPNLREANVLMYEPSTNIVTLSFGAEAEVAKWDAKSRQLTKLASITKPSPYEQELLAPLNPKLANELQLVHVVMRDKPTIKWLRDPRSLATAASQITIIDGSYAGADAAGHVFVWRNSPSSKLELAVYADGKPIAQLPAQGPVSLWPDPDGKRVIEIAANSVGLYQTTDGKQLWTQELSAVQEALWLSDGSLAITSAGGIARLDPANGSITASRCGWRFGLTSAPHPQTSRIEPLCAQRAIQ
ncbi:MAG TPA: hypothetical protein VMZ53_26905 [Kofleriaceae bacterium]|nr:hypothetical protein [Kofleriaceae bacterium]